MKKFIFGILMAWGLMAQTPPNVLQISAPQLPPVTSVGTQYVGPQGNSQYCYWVVAIYAVGNAQISNSQCTNVNPQGGGQVNVSWGVPNTGGTPPLYPFAFDVVRTVGGVFNNPCNNCLLMGATGTNTAVDMLGSLTSGYSLNTYSPGMATLRVNNISTSTPNLVITLPDNRTVQSNVDFGLVLPTFCSAGSQFIVTGNGSSAGLYACLVQNVWTASIAGNVISVTATAPLTSSGGPNPNISATYQGNGLKIQASTGSVVSQDCAKFDVNGNVVDAGAPCGTGTGTVVSVSGTSPVVSSGGTTPAISCPTCTVGGVTAVTASGVLASSGGTTPNITCSTCGAGTVTGVTATSPILSSGGASPVISCPTCSTSGGTVTAVTATAPIISTGGATPVISATYQGTGLKVQASTGTATNGDCVQFDSTGNTVDSLTPCSGGIANSILVTNSSSGTVANELVKLTGAPSTGIKAATTDTGGIVGICNSQCTVGPTAAIIITAGLQSCIFDGATTAGDYVQISSGTAGECHDTGSGSYPSSGQVLGRVLSTNGAGGTFQMDLFPSEIQSFNPSASCTFCFVGTPTGATGVTGSIPSVGGATSVGFSSIPGTFNNLILHACLVSNRLSTSDGVLVILNSDATGGDYTGNQITLTNTTVSGSGNSSNFLAAISAVTATVGQPGCFDVTIPAYANSQNLQKMLNVAGGFGSAGGGVQLNFTSVLWAGPTPITGTVPITSISVIPQHGTAFSAGSISLNAY